MRDVKIIDMTLRMSDQASASGLSFREQIEIAKLLEKLRVDVIETGPVSGSQVDAVVLRTIANTIQGCAISCPVGLDQAAIDRSWAALRQARRPRLNLLVPASAVQMEYSYQLKPNQLLERVAELAAYCRSLGPELELTAEDATRSEEAFLVRLLQTALKAGAATLTLCDSAGLLLPEEAAAFISRLRQAAPELATAEIAFQAQNDLGLATANSLAALRAGVSQLKAACNGLSGLLSLDELARALQLRGEALDVRIGLNTTALQRTCKQLERLMGMERTGRTAFSRVVGNPEPEEGQQREALTAEADLLTVRRRVESLGYDLPPADVERVFRRFNELAAKKSVDNRDLEALVAEVAQQVAPAFQLVNYVINSGSAISATAFLRLDKQGEALQTVSLGDGPIDAAFLAMEQLLGHHFELEDFQIQAVTEGREAMGDALVKLRHNGKLYSGRGLSTDIIGASIRAYLNAVNKIVYEEQHQ